MAESKVNIISNAISLLGHKPIVSLENGDSLVVAAEQAFDMLLPAILSENNWRWATQIQQLSLSGEVPPHPWKSIYLLPAGYLKTIRVYPNVYDWEIYENSKLYAMHSYPFWMEYTFVPDVSKFPARFVKYFVYVIGTYLALSNAQKPEYYAQLKSERDICYAMCAAIEAQNRPQFTQANFPVLDNRQRSNVIGTTVNG